MLPFHTWLPDAHVEAPTAGSVILAGVLLKMGDLRLPALRDAALPAGRARRASRPVIIALAVIAILYGALVAMVQPDMKKLVAYSSVSHMGFVDARPLRLQHAGLRARLQMVNHGISTGALFLLVGMIYERTAHAPDRDFGGL